MRRAPILLAPLAIALALAAVAIAKTTIHDGDDTVGIDVKSATFSKTKSGKLKFVVVFYEKVPPNGNDGNEFLNMWKSRPHVQSDCSCIKESPYTISGPQTGRRPIGTGGEAGTQFHKTGTGTVRRKGKTLTFVVPRKAIGKPKHRFYWRIRSDYYGSDAQCGPMLANCEDHAPNGNKVVKQPL